MSLEMIESALGLLIIPIAGVHTLVYLRAAFAVKGTRVHYTHLSLTIAFFGLQALIAFARAVLSVAIGEYGATGIQLLLAVVYIFYAWKLSKDGGNWFNDQFKRLKRGLKKLRQQLANALTPPKLAPAPA